MTDGYFTYKWGVGKCRFISWYGSQVQVEFADGQSRLIPASNFFSDFELAKMSLCRALNECIEKAEAELSELQDHLAKVERL